MAREKHRYFIVGSGRSGSSLLAAILADAGAAFSMEHIDSWDRGAGEYEHPLVHQARRWHSRAAKINESLIPNALAHGFCVRRMRKALDALLHEAEFVKSTDLVHLVPVAAHLRYTPVVIVSYRPFAAHARSRHRKDGMDAAHLLADYINIYTTAALQLQIFGGGVVSYDELVNSEQIAWAETLDTLTGIPSQQILAAREKRVSEIPRNAPAFDLPVSHAMIDQLHATYMSLLGRVIEPVERTRTSRENQGGRP